MKNIMKEIYKDIPNYKGYYQVSNLGNVKSVDRCVICKGGAYRLVKSKIINQNVLNHGYFGVSLWKNNKGKTYQVHQLVAMAFLGHKPSGFKLVVNHKDFNKLNNKLDNLEVITNRENTSKEHIKSASKYVGVYKNTRLNKWQSAIRINGKRKYLGVFDTEVRASIAYDLALLQIHKF